MLAAMAKENNLDDALLPVLEQMSLGQPKVEIPGTGGLSLQVGLERMPGWRWPVLQAPLEKTWLRLEDRYGNVLAAYGTSMGESAARLRRGSLRYTLQILLARLIIGTQGKKPMTELVEEWAEIMGPDGRAGADAEMAKGWLRKVTQAEVGGPEV